MTDAPLKSIPLDRLRDHPANANVMRADLLDTLTRHIDATGHYPPLIVRPMPGEGGAYQLLDGHHRRAALDRLGHAAARCVVWDVDDEQALVLLATLNRLEGADDPRRRAKLIAELNDRLGRGRADLAKLLPESSAAVAKLLSLNNPLPKPRPAPRLADLPRATHFFLLPAERARLDAALARLGGTREQALMRMVERSRADER